MAGYGWEEYDVRKGGRQIINDVGNQIDITTEFIKVPGGNHGGNWGLRIRGEPREDASEDLKTTVVLYTAMEGAFGPNITAENANFLVVNNEPDPLGFVDSVMLSGITTELGQFQMEVTKGPATNRHPGPEHPSWEERPLDRTLVRSGRAPEEHLWQAKGMATGLTCILWYMCR